MLNEYVWKCNDLCKCGAWVNITCEWWQQNVCNCLEKNMLNEYVCKCNENAVYEYDKWWIQNDMSLMMPWRDVWCNQGTRQGESTSCP